MEVPCSCKISVDFKVLCNIISLNIELLLIISFNFVMETFYLIIIIFLLLFIVLLSADADGE
jgi:hypothetical protein